MTATHTFTASALLFDMDGTLVDSTAVSERVWRAWAADSGADVTSVLAYSHGRRTLDTTRHFSSSEEAAAASARWIEAQEIAAEDGTFAIPGAKALLESLPDDRWAVVTSAGPMLAARRLAAAGLPIPPVLITAAEVECGKPDPEGYFLAAERLGVSAPECIVFEDTFAGHEAARRGGMRSINRQAVPHNHACPIHNVTSYEQATATQTDSGILIEFGEFDAEQSTVADAA